MARQGRCELYGPKYGLPVPIATVNGFHDRGWGPFEPETLIVVGGNLEDESRFFEGCSVVATVHLPYDVQNEETVDHPQILVCHHLRSRGRWCGEGRGISGRIRSEGFDAKGPQS